MKKILSRLFAIAMLVFVLFPVAKVSADTLQITTNSLPNATIGQPYSTQIQVSGGTAPYTWETLSTTYPSGCCVLGLSGNSQPIYSNSVTFNTQSSATVIDTYSAGNYSWVLKVTDSVGNTTTKTVYLTINPALQITTNSLPDATIDQLYSTQIYVSGGTAPYTWTTLSTTYPSGCCVLGLSGNSQPIYGNSVIFNTQSGSTVISTHPAGTYTWTIEVKDASGNKTKKILSLNIKTPSNPSTPYFQINTSQLPAATVGVYYSTKIDFQYFTSGTNYASNAIFSGLPPGITTGSASSPNTTYGIVYNNPGSVTISGTPAIAGTYTVTLSLTDQYSANLSKQFILVVNNPSSPAPVPQPVSGAAHANYTNIVAPDGTVYRIESGARYPYTSAGAFLSYGFNTWATIVPATTGDMALPVSTYTPSGSTQQTTYFIPPRNGSLINDKGTIYLITNGIRVGFANAQSFLELDYSFANAQPGDTSFMVTLAPINNSATAHPDGTLIRDNKTVYLLKNNTRLGIPSMEVFYSWGLNMNEVVSANNYDLAAPVSGVLNTRMENQLSI